MVSKFKNPRDTATNENRTEHIKDMDIGSVLNSPFLSKTESISQF